MTTNFPIPESALAQHTSILGKTGSGKTSTGKLVVEHVVDLGERVCILDPIKSDWWGLTSSADGKRPGLPFQILGGPHGHVSLHDGAGAAIAELVASGALPLSIIDMADFGPGGQARFFVDFAPVLLRRMRGVLRLVIGEAHLFAPKERSGIGAENMAIHWAKVLATAGRSKGIRLVVETQSVQQLHNRVLGSCENLVAMRLTAPADQKPVIDWLKANAPKDVEAQIRTSLASLKTGTGWLCSGEAGIFQKVAFPRIRTFDNSATPEAGDADHHVVQAQVDQAQLRALIGDAEAEAAANDPAHLRARIAELEQQLQREPAAGTYTAADMMEAHKTGERIGYERAREEIREHLAGVMLAIQQTGATIAGEMDRLEASVAGIGKEISGPAIPPTGNFCDPVSEPVAGGSPRVAPLARPVRDGFSAAGNPTARTDTRNAAAGGSSNLGKADREVLAVLAAFREGCTAGKLTLLTGKRYSGGFRNTLSKLRTAGLITGENTGTMRITDAGLACGPFEPMPSPGRALFDWWLQHPSFGITEREVLRVLAKVGSADGEHLARLVGKQYSGGFRNVLSNLRTAGVIVGRNTELMRLAEDVRP